MQPDHERAFRTDPREKILKFLRDGMKSNLEVSAHIGLEASRSRKWIKLLLESGEIVQSKRKGTRAIFFELLGAEKREKPRRYIPEFKPLSYDMNAGRDLAMMFHK